MSVSIRAYRPTDHHACRALWAELTELHRDLYDESDAADGDPGAGFEDYLTRLDLSGMWVAEHSDDGVVGLVGLLLSGRSGEVYPVVVTQRHRGKGVGSALLRHVAEQARQRSLRRLLVVPESRNVVAVRALHSSGFDSLAAVRLAMELTGRSDGGDQITLHDREFTT